MIEAQKNEVLTYQLRHPVLMERVKLAMAILVAAQLLVCIACSVWGKSVVAYAWVAAFVRGMNWLIPAVSRLGSLSLDPEVGRFTFAAGMVISILFGIAFFIWGMFYRTFDEHIEYWTKLSGGAKIKSVLGLLFGSTFILTDFGLIHWIGMATARGMYEYPDQIFVHYLVSDGVKYGISSAAFCFCIGSAYGLVLGGWIKVVPAWIKASMSSKPLPF